MIDSVLTIESTLDKIETRLRASASSIDHSGFLYRRTRDSATKLILVTSASSRSACAWRVPECEQLFGSVEGITLCEKCMLLGNIFCYLLDIV
jgi:hypothetical protein